MKRKNYKQRFLDDFANVNDITKTQIEQSLNIYGGVHSAYRELFKALARTVTIVDNISFLRIKGSDDVIMLKWDRDKLSLLESFKDEPSGEIES